ncbi:hypothetical protein WA158_000958 [Blastocystis sp. Blastoise]
MAILKKNKRRQIVADGVFYAELDEFLTRELAQDGYAGIEIKKDPMCTSIIIRATRTQAIVGEKARRINELTSVVQKRWRWNFPENAVKMFAERVYVRGLCAATQAESLKYKLIGGLPVRRAAYAIIRNCLEDGAKGVEVIVSGKLRQQRANAMKFKEGYMLKTGHGVEDFVAVGKKHVLMKQGVLGVVVKIMLPQDPKGLYAPKKNLPDVVIVHEPKEYPAVVVAEPVAEAVEATEAKTL